MQANFSSFRRAARSLGLVTVGILSTLGALSLTHIGPASAQSPGVNLAQLVAQVGTLKAQVAALRAKTAPLSVSGSDLTISGVNVHIVDGTGVTESTSGLGNLIVGYNESRGRFRRFSGTDARSGSHNIITGVFNNYASSGGIVGGCCNSLNGLEEFAVGTENAVSGNQASIAGGINGKVTADHAFAPTVAGPAGPGFTPEKIAILNAFTLSEDPSAHGANTLLTITGVNVRIVNGLGGTQSVNGLGNLIIGYNEEAGTFNQDRIGSHNLVVGTAHNYLSYGGIVAGQNNSIEAPFACAVGGYFNVARSGHATVSGGSGNVASGGSSSVSGGQNNVASADYASVSGGQDNVAASGHDSVSGGSGNVASGGSSSISGGSGITEESDYGWRAGSESGSLIPILGNFVSDYPR